MTKSDFKAAVLASEFCKFSKDEKRHFLELLESFEPLFEDFFENVFFALILNHRFFYLKELIELFKQEIEKDLEKLAKQTRIKNFNQKLFLSESELIKRFFRKKLYEKLPKWFI